MIYIIFRWSTLCVRNICDLFILWHASYIWDPNFTDQPFKFTKQLKSKTVTENHKVVLECEVDEPEADVEWFFGDKPLTPDVKGYGSHALYILDQHSTYSHLVILLVTCVLCYNGSDMVNLWGSWKISSNIPSLIGSLALIVASNYCFAESAQ